MSTSYFANSTTLIWPVPAKDQSTAPQQAPATTTVLPAAPAAWMDDVLVRMQVNSSGALEELYWVQPTQAVYQRFYDWIKGSESDIRQLKSVTNWQKRRLDYQELYNAYILGSISEDEFIQESESFITDIKETPINELAARIKHVSALLDFELSVSDFADFLDSDPEAVHRALSALMHDHPEIETELPQLARLAHDQIEDFGPEES